MDFILNHSSEEFAERFIQSGIPEFTLVERKNLCIRDEFEPDQKGIFCKHCGTVIRNVDRSQNQITCPHCHKEINLED